MGWLAAIVVIAIAVFLVRNDRRRRRRAEAELQKLASWSEELRTSGSMPQTGPLLSRVIADAVANLEKIGTELTNTRRAQAADSSSLKTILSGMAQGVMVVDRGHTIRRVNPSFMHLLELQGNPLGGNVRRSFRDLAFDDLVTAVLRTGQTQTSELAVPKDDPVRHLAITATLIEEPPGESSALLICHDVTRLRQLENIRREFVANVSHELRTPLAIFQGYVEALLENPEMPQEERENVFHVLKRHSTRLNALVEDLLVLARLESRVDKLEAEPIDPGQLLRDVVMDWQIAAGKKSLSIAANCATDAPSFQADLFRVEQVLHNLVENAMKHTSAGGNITLRAAGMANHIELRVEDNGVGINSQDLPHIFERFYRADKARSREQGGTGLGLSIVKHIVQLHGGTVSAESAPGRGTSIIVQLPLCPPPYPVRRSSSVENSET